MKGSIEVIVNGVSTGMVVNVRDVDAIPIVVEAGQSLSEVVPVASTREGVDAEWTASTPDGFQAIVLWREDRELTIGEIAAAIDAEGA